MHYANLVPTSLQTVRGAALGSGLLALLVLTGCHRCPVNPLTIQVDPAGNGVFEPGKATAVEPTWHYFQQSSPTGCGINNPCPPSAVVAGNTSNFTGPAGGVYTIVDDTADYGTITRGAAASCAVTSNCYQLLVSAPDGRPATHWDTTVTEVVNGGGGSWPASWTLPIGESALVPEACPILYGSRTWTLHVGKSFVDVPTDGFYPYIENLFHHGVTAGCDVNQYCPGNPIRREQMAVFLLKSLNGSGYVPPPCGGAFADVPCPGPFSDWVEDISNQGIIAGCGGGNFCPKDAVLRRNMAHWLLKAHDGAAFVPPAATGLFADVPADDPDAPWIEELYRRQVTAGCNADPLLYCPDRTNTRAQMAVFVVKNWGMRLY